VSRNQVEWLTWQVTQTLGDLAPEHDVPAIVSELLGHEATHGTAGIDGLSAAAYWGIVARHERTAV